MRLQTPRGQKYCLIHLSLLTLLPHGQAWHTEGASWEFADISLSLLSVVPFGLLGVIRQTHTMALPQAHLPINLCCYSWRAASRISYDIVKPLPSLADRLHSCFVPPKSRLFDVYLYFFSLHFQTHSIFLLFLCTRTSLHVLFQLILPYIWVDRRWIKDWTLPSKSLQERKPRLREGESPAQAYTVGKAEAGIKCISVWLCCEALLGLSCLSNLLKVQFCSCQSISCS